MSAVLAPPAAVSAWNVSSELDVLRPYVEARILAWIDRLPPKRLYHTRGLYEDGTYVDNAVRSDELANHIEYNLSFRPGRALFVHGYCVGRGMLSDDVLRRMAEELLLHPVHVFQDNAPYR